MNFYLFSEKLNVLSIPLLPELIGSVVNFSFRNWEGFFTNVLAATFIAFLAIKYIKVPNFELHADFIPPKRRRNILINPVLDISIMNKKRFFGLLQIGFNPQEVNFGLFIPIDFVKNKKFLLMTNLGEVEWMHKLEGKQPFVIDRREYYLFRGIVNLSVYPDSRVQFLRLIGDFSRDKAIKIYYYFNTPYGRFPKSLRFGAIQKSAESKKLPFSEVNFRN